MDRRITARMNMFTAMMRLCSDRREAVITIPAFARRVTQLGDRMAVLQVLIQRLLQNMDGLSGAKDAAKTELSLVLSVGCGAGVAYAKEIKDLVLEQKFDFSESDFMRMRDIEVIEAADNIIALLTTHASALKEYGIDALLTARLLAARSDFEARSPEPIVKVYANEADLTELLKKTFEVSAFVLNDLMASAKVFKLNDSNFYQALVNTSRISKVGIRHKKTPEEQALQTAQKEAAAAEKKRLKAERRTQLEQQRRQEAGELQQLLEELNQSIAPPAANGVSG